MGYMSEQQSDMNRTNSDEALEMQKKFRACLLGGAIGDALGAPIEFLSIFRIRNQFGQAGLSNFYPAYDKLGGITDDTQMTLFTAEGVLRGLVRNISRGISGAEIEIVKGAYLRWLQTQDTDYNHNDFDSSDGWLIQQEALWSRRAPGNTCLNALRSNRPGVVVNNDSKGCGTVMRVAPVGLVYDGDAAYRFGKATSEITHSHSTSTIAAGATALLIALLKSNVDLETALYQVLAVVENDEKTMNVIAETSDALRQAIDLTAIGVEPTPEMIESMGGAWVAEEALAISVYCALVAEDFSHGVLLAVNHSGDSDSTGAITGNILGLVYGLDSIPKKWLEQVELSDVITQVANDLYEVPRRYSDYDADEEYNSAIFKRYPGC
jgi:ADP-ribosyl-[dinitrogen reductase] hydrolase